MTKTSATVFLGSFAFIGMVFAFSSLTQHSHPSRDAPLKKSRPHTIKFPTFEEVSLSQKKISNRHPAIQTSIPTLLDHAGDFHQQLVSVRGVIKQPELHLDETQLYEHFVFRLTEGTRYVTIFGIHDRTQGGSVISMDRKVEVMGVFYKERSLNDDPLSNLIEAFTVSPYPSLEPERTEGKGTFTLSPIKKVFKISTASRTPACGGERLGQDNA